LSTETTIFIGVGIYLAIMLYIGVRASKKAEGVPVRPTSAGCWGSLPIRLVARFVCSLSAFSSRAYFDDWAC